MKKILIAVYRSLAAVVFLMAAAACTRVGSTDYAGSVQGEPQTSKEDSTTIVSAVEQFHDAVTAGDSLAVVDLLAPDALILESGGKETKAEYLSHHFHSDGAFLSATTRELTSRRVFSMGGVAWVASISRIHGTYRDRDVDINSAELLVLNRVDADWKISAVHWSSRGR